MKFVSPYWDNLHKTEIETLPNPINVTNWIMTREQLLKALEESLDTRKIIRVNL